MSTPQDIALKDAVRGVEMFKKVEVPVNPLSSIYHPTSTAILSLILSRPSADQLQILGMVQNMSAFTCPTCNSTHSIFGSEGVTRKCEEMDIKLLADIPLHARICEDADKGKPTVVAEPESVRAKAFRDLAETLRVDLGF